MDVTDAFAKVSPACGLPAGQLAGRGTFIEILVLMLCAIPPVVFSFAMAPRMSGESESPQEIPEGEISFSEVKQLSQPVLWIDARTEFEFEQSHVPGAILLNQDNWDDAVGTLFEAWTPDHVVVVYCASQACGQSHDVANRLRRDAGLENVFVLHDGWRSARKLVP